ncbi:coiled-coil domain-containing protein [Melissospora conviva]|uniref:coiled-coil domain-containing protein n=1 Tax=Melissospora conviva TaxID=3388432 RepID=UPI003C28ACBE
MTAPLRRWLTGAVAALTAAIVVVGPAGVAAADPDTPSGHGQANDDSVLLGDALETVTRGYLQAEKKLEKSKKRQLRLELRLDQANARVEKLRPQVEQIAIESYRSGRISTVAVLLESSSSGSFLERVTTLEELNMINNDKIGELNAARDEAAQAKAEIDAEVAEQEKQAKTMRKQREETEKALSLVGGSRLPGNGLVAATSPRAAMAPGRNSDGSWAPEGCTQGDPTTSGCLTPRTLHMYKEARKAGFTRFTGCFRTGDIWEHPKGRACDFSLQSSGFSPAYTQDQMLYGNNLTAFLIRNADRLGIYYIIWHRNIWFPSTGWAGYSGTSDHTDHVHVSLL